MTAGLGLMKAAAACLFAGPGLAAAALASLGWAGLAGEAGRPFAGLGLIAAVFWAPFG